jgi:predicted esterase
MARNPSVGYSNGANIAAAVLFCASEPFAGAILLRAMAPLVERRDQTFPAFPC